MFLLTMPVVCYVIIKHQVAIKINATETIKAKLTFEKEDQKFRDLLKKQQNIRFIGAAPHIKMGQQSATSRR